MEILKSWISLAALAVIASGCADTVTRTDYLETDTYISSADPSNHSDLPVLNISRAPTLEERVLVKFPTGARDPNVTASDLLSDATQYAGPGAALVLWPFYFHLEIIADLLNCQGKGLSASNLAAATLVFNVNSTAETSLAGKVQLESLAKPWFQSANWDRGHPYSTRGRWSQAGGDVDSTFAAVPGSAGSRAGSPTLEFDVKTQFVKWIVTPDSVHFGMLLRSSGTALGSTVLESVQSTTMDRRPRLVSTYNCVNTGSTGFVSHVDHWQTTVTILGAPTVQ